MKIRLITLLLIVHFLKELVWLAIIPLWHFHDEEQHFAQTAFYVEKGRFPQGLDIDVNQEIDLSSEILETKSDLNLKFIYNPEYRIPYTKTQIGLYEGEIKALNTPENRKRMVKQEAARYGPVYYLLTAIPYKIFYSSDLFVRVFSSRFVSVVLSTINVLIVYLIAKEIFKKELLRLTLTSLVSFQPMFSFVSAGVNSDNLFNLIFTLILYLCLKIFFSEKKQISSTLTAIFLTATFIIGFYTKTQIFIVFPTLIFAFILSFFAKKKRSKKQYLLNLGFILGLILLGLTYWYLTRGKLNIPEYMPEFQMGIKDTFGQHLLLHVKRTVAEVIPWYWGVFRWSSVTLPAWVNQIQARILIVSALGILVYFIKQIRKKRLLKINNLRIIFLLGAAVAYYFAVITWDYFFRIMHRYSFGIQGRYFFPTIVSHMLFIVLGIVTLIPKNFKTIFIRVLTFWWFIFNLIGLYIATTAYYQLLPISTFLNQASQYKPVVFKATGTSIIMVSFLTICFIFMLKFFAFDERKN